MADAEKKMQKFAKDFELINKSLKGTSKSLCDIKFAEVPSANKREDLFGVIKELCTLTKKMLAAEIPATPNSTTNPDERNLEELIKNQLTNILPGILQKALKDQAPAGTAEKKDEVKKPTTHHTLEVEKTCGGEDDKTTVNEWFKKTRGVFKDKLKDFPVKAAVSESGAKLHFENKEDLDKATNALKNEYKVTSKSEEKRKLTPKISLSGIHADITDDTVLKKGILLKNEQIRSLESKGEVFKVVKFDKEKQFAVLQVSPKIREVIRANRDRISIDLEYYHVKDRIHVIQCYHCQKYGHMRNSDYCKQKGQDATCLYCAGPHPSKECSKKGEKSQMKCSNCANSKNKSDRDACGTHKALDTLCPFYIRERAGIMSRTAGCDEAKNLYLKKTRELKAKFGRV